MIANLERMKMIEIPIGTRFSRLVVTAKEQVGTASQWRCECDCGASILSEGSPLRRGTKKSCGCLNIDAIITRNTKHGQSGLPEYRIWGGMIDRCERPGSTVYKHYGAKGVKVCPRWRADFTAFYADMGPRPSPKHSIDRWPNARGNYEPGNCRWATRSEQNSNNTQNVLLTLNGVTANTTQWASKIGIRPATLRRRLFMGWSPERALTTKLRRKQQ